MLNTLAPNATTLPPLAVEMRQIRKYFTSTNVQAADDVSLEVRAGEVHALVGENGAGKTTLMNMLYGLIPPDSGEVRIHGQPARIHHPDDAIRLGIGMVHQHFKLVPSFTVAENIMLGLEPNKLGFINGVNEADAVRALADQFGLPINPNGRVRDLAVGLQQRVEILKTLQRDAQIIILDEPTAVLTPGEVAELYAVIRRLAKSGRTVILITHKLLEVKAVADRVSIMRRGQNVGTYNVADVSVRDMANLMVGRSVVLEVEKTPAKPGAPVLQVENILVAGVGGVPAVFGASLEVCAGEILGIAGVSGNGQTELAEAIMGLRPVDAGSIFLSGTPITTDSVRQRRTRGMAHVPEDRMVMGLNLNTNLDENAVANRYPQPPFSARGIFRFPAVRAFAARLVEAFNIRSARVGGSIRQLSGGNLQKIVLGREFDGDPAFILANQPTRGLDVGSIEFVHKTLIAERDKGAAVLLISVELDEIFALSDRIAVMFAGRIMGVLPRAEATEEKIALLMAGETLDSVSLPVAELVSA